MADAASVPPEKWESTSKPTLTHAQITLILMWGMTVVYYCYTKLARKSSVPPSSGGLTTIDTSEAPIYSVVVFGAIMFYMWLLDDRQILPIHGKHYNRDFFLFLCLAILLWTSSTRKESKRPGVLSREQTEEWKGWMQIMFLLYHYFAAKEFYNVIRVLIASYVWMTGFGNFSYFKLKEDYSLWRVLKMLFRLNFLVFVMCLLMNTDYVLYYICPMHTMWFLSVYAVMAIRSDWNKSNTMLGIKMTVFFIIVFMIWEVPFVFDLVWSPLQWLLMTDGSMHEWQFRTTLDHWATFVGMLCAWALPWVKQQTQASEIPSPSATRERYIKSFFSIIGAIVGYAWYTEILLLPKLEYNSKHPYFSFVPIILYIGYRNLFPSWRKFHLELLASAGKITLETYLCQFHIWMCRHNEKYVGALVEIIPGYPLVNFMVTTGIYIALSQRLFDLTTVFSSYMLMAKPISEPSEWKLIGRRWVSLVAIFASVYLFVVGYRVLVNGHPNPIVHYGNLAALDKV